MEGRVNAPGSGILFCHPCCQAEWLTGCLSAQHAGMIGSWPAENGLASFTYIHISWPLSCYMCVLRMCIVCVRICKSDPAMPLNLCTCWCPCMCVCVGVTAIMEHPDVSAASLGVCH